MNSETVPDLSFVPCIKLWQERPLAAPGGADGLSCRLHARARTPAAAPRTPPLRPSRRAGGRSPSPRPGPWRAARASAVPKTPARKDAALGGPGAEQGPRADPRGPRPPELQLPPGPRET